MLDLAVAFGVGSVVGFALGSHRLIKAGHPCREDGCFARVGVEHDNSPRHRRGLQ